MTSIQQRFRSAWASAQSDQSLRCPQEESLGPWLPFSAQWRLIRLGGCPGWSESSLDAQVILLVVLCGSSILIKILKTDNDKDDLSCSMTKPNDLWASRRLLSASASAQSDLSFLSAWRSIGSSATHECTAKTLIRLRRYIVFVGHTSFCWLCHAVAHFLFRLMNGRHYKYTVCDNTSYFSNLLENNLLVPASTQFFFKVNFSTLSQSEILSTFLQG